MSNETTNSAEVNATDKVPQWVLDANEMMRRDGIDPDFIEHIAQTHKFVSGIPSTGENLKLTPEEAESLVHHMFISPRYEKNFPDLFKD